MKKREIEKIPYLTLKKVSGDKNVRYIGVTACKDIANEEHLFLEVYKNSRDSMEIPQVRIVLTQKDFGNFFPATGTWSRQKIETSIYSYEDKLLWYTAEDTRCPWNELPAQNILMSKKDSKRIQRYCDGRYMDERWWAPISSHENMITAGERNRAAKRRYERRQQALGDRIAHTPELPEQKILSRADIVIFDRKHHLYYKKKGCWAKIACSKCGGVAEMRWKGGISYESQFQPRIEDPREGTIGICQLCGAAGEYKCQGKVNIRHDKSAYMFLGQRYKEKGMVIRYIKVEKFWELCMREGEKGPEMYGAREELSGVEIARAYFMPGKKVQKDYHKHNPYSGEDFWDDCNLYGNANITIKSAPVMDETYEEMKGTMFQYSALQEYVREAGEVNVIDYLDRYKETPQIEMLVKIGLTGIVERLITCHYGIVMDESADRADAFLGIRKERVRQLARNKGNVEMLDTMQAEKRLGQNWTEEQIEQLTEIGMARTDQIFSYMGVQRFLNRVKKYAGCEYGTMCSTASDMLRRTAQTYVDYLNMRRDLGYDMDNTVYLFPRDLTTAHEKMVTESNKEKEERRKKEVNERYPMIRKAYRRLRKEYYYEDEEFLIRPARDAGEIVMEGRILHHCVGGDQYLRGHNEGKDIILFLRSKKEPDMPYITVEIGTRTRTIRQWYGAKDKKPDESRMQKWMDDYVIRLRGGMAGAALAAGGEEMAQRLLAYA